MGLLVGESATARGLAERLKWHLVGVGSIAILVLFFDFLQYFVGYLKRRATLSAEIEKTSKSEGHYNKDAWLYKLRKVFFYAKVVLLFVGVFWLLGALGFWLVTGNQTSMDFNNVNPPQELHAAPKPTSTPDPFGQIHNDGDQPPRAYPL